MTGIKQHKSKTLFWFSIVVISCLIMGVLIMITINSVSVNEPLVGDYSDIGMEVFWGNFFGSMLGLMIVPFIAFVIGVYLHRNKKPMRNTIWVIILLSIVIYSIFSAVINTHNTFFQYEQDKIAKIVAAQWTDEYMTNQELSGGVKRDDIATYFKCIVDNIDGKRNGLVRSVIASGVSIDNFYAGNINVDEKSRIQASLVKSAQPYLDPCLKAAGLEVSN